MKIAVVTGASSGIGREFVMKIDEMNCVDEIWMISRRKERMNNIAMLLNGNALPVELDLTDPKSFDEYKRLLEKKDAEVEFLVNSAGFGKFGSVSSQHDSDVDGMIRLNITALVMMCKITMPYMLTGGKIINMSSVSGFIPLPYLNIYSATKAFVYNFSKSLNFETRKYGITSTAVCPYWMNTEFISVARDTPDGDAVNNFIFLYEPEKVATRAIADSLMGKSESVYGAVAGIIKKASGLIPDEINMRLWNKLRKKGNSEFESIRQFNEDRLTQN